MGLSCGGNFLKFLVFFFNAIVFIGGGIVAGYGIYLLVEAKETGGSISVALPAFITALGLLLFLVGFLGCFGACYNNTCMLKTFAAIVGILLVAEVIGGIVLLVFRHNFVNLVADELQKLITDYNDEKIAASSYSIEALLKIQEEFKCCGGKGPSDWKVVPKSCCKSTTRTNSTCTTYSTGCARAMYEEIKDSTLVLGIIIVVIALIQIGAVICAACLAKKVNEYEQV